MRIIDTYERVRGVPLQDVDIQDAVIGALSRADTTMHNELIYNLNKDTLTSQKISISQVRNMAGSAYRTQKEQSQLKNHSLKQPREKAMTFVDKTPEKRSLHIDMSSSEVENSANSEVKSSVSS
jgi:hypothetical protein